MDGKKSAVKKTKEVTKAEAVHSLSSKHRKKKTKKENKELELMRAQLAKL